MRALAQPKSNFPFDPADAVYFSERDRVVASKRTPRFPPWRRRLFAFLYRNAVHPADLFNLPSAQFVQISRQIEI